MAVLRAPLDFSRETSPKLWARVRKGLGDTLRDLAIRRRDTTRVGLLEEAIAAYKSALEVYTPEAVPTKSVETRQNLERAETELQEAKAGAQ